MGAILFERGRTGARPTAAGQRAVVHARQILRQLELLGADARGAAAGSVCETLRIAAFRRAAAGQVADGHADIAIATLGTEDTAAGTLPGMVTGDLLREPFLLACPAGHPDPRGLPLIDWPENCSSYTRAWWARQEWLPPATVTVADDGVVLAMVAQGLGMAILPRLTLAGLPPGVTISTLGDDPPVRRIISVTTGAAGTSLAAREFVRELRAAASTGRRAPGDPGS